MKKLTCLVLVAMIGAIAAGCQTQEVEPEAAAPEVEVPLKIVEVAAEGTEFDPPVEPGQIPDGVWYCPMEKVHYASGEQGEGTCPLCAMNLVQKAPAEPEPEVEAETEG